MIDPRERINSPISDAELERRWSAIRKAMQEQGIAVLIAQANNDFMGGYVKYLTDIPATNGYVRTVIFPVDAPMTTIGQGAFGMDRSAPPGSSDPLMRGIGRVLGTPSYASAMYSAPYDGELAEKALAGYAKAKIGLLGTAGISYALIERLRKGALSGATFVDASDLVDQIKCIKSDEEIALIRKTAAMQDLAMQQTMAAIRPGMRDIEVTALAEQIGHAHGSEQGLFLAASGKLGTPAFFGNRHVQNRVIQEGDSFTLLIENNGPGGYYCEIGRTCVLGKAPQQMKDEFELILAAQRNTLAMVRPGADCKAIWESHNAFMRAHKRPEENRVYFHGQGYDMVERPLVRFDEPMKLAARMNLAMHPAFVNDSVYAWYCDNFLINPDGQVEHLHRTPQRIIELG